MNAFIDPQPHHHHHHHHHHLSLSHDFDAQIKTLTLDFSIFDREKVEDFFGCHFELFIESLVSSGVGAAWNTANVQKGFTVAVFGLGAVGLAVTEGARIRGASKIIGVNINPEKFVKEHTICFSMARRDMGVMEFVNPMDWDKPMHEVIRKMTKGGVYFSFECAGNLDVLLEAFSSTHDGSYRKILVRQTWMPLSYFRNQFAATYISVSHGFSSC